MEEQKKEMTTREVAVYLGLSVSWVYQLVRDDKIPFYKRPGRERRGGGLRFEVEQIDAWKGSGKAK